MPAFYCVCGLTHTEGRARCHLLLYSFLATFHKRVGNPDTEEEFLNSRSPLFKVDQIKIPILIGHGANDPRVKQAESEQIVEAMKSRGSSLV